MLIATDFILKSIGLGPIPKTVENKRLLDRLKRKTPQYVLCSVTKEFEVNGSIMHNRTCRILDLGHDWTFDESSRLFRMCTRVERVAIVFEVEEVTFCAGCGSRMPCADC